jgi:SAM-dependent methyltransferase
VYPLSPDLVTFLLSPGAQSALAGLAALDLSEAASLSLLSQLRRTFTPPQAAALLDQARLRRRASAKFPQAGRLLFVEEALQQASSRNVATYRAQGFAAFHRIADLGCGIGADTIALAEAGLQVLAVERDPVRCQIAAANLAALGLSGRVEVRCADWTTLALGSLVDVAFVDPSRRRGEHRIFRLSDMEPPIDAILALQAQVPHVAVKTAPGIANASIPTGAEVEFISDRGELKEALLRFGGLRSGAARQATLLPGPHTLNSNAPQHTIPLSEPLAYLYEPDPAILRATLVRHLATQLDAAQLDPAIAYLSSATLAATPFARSWQVLRHGPFHLKTLQRWLRELGPGEVVVKKRGSAIDPDAFRRRLKTSPGGPALTVFLTRVRSRPWMIVASEVR